MAKKERNRRSARQARSAARAEAEQRAEAAGESTSKAVSKAEAKSKSKEVTKASNTGVLASIRNYFSTVKTEMQRVTWPNRTELINYSFGVVCMLIVFGVAVWLVDTGIVALLVAFSNLRG